jgi:hypothetical protein
MNEKPAKPRVRSILRGAFLLAPLALIPFGVLFFEAWLHLAIRHNDILNTRLTQEQQALEERENELEVQEAELRRKVRQERLAKELGLVKRHPSQLEVVPVPGVKPEAPAPSDLEVARSGD